MSAFSTVSDMFSDPEFSAPGHSCLWGLGVLDEQHRECTGFLIMSKRPYEWRVDSHGCLDLGINLLTSLCSSTFTPDPAVSPTVSKHNQESLTGNMTNLSVRRNNAHDHAPVHQGVSDASRRDPHVPIMRLSHSRPTLQAEGLGVGLAHCLRSLATPRCGRVSGLLTSEQGVRILGTPVVNPEFV